MKLISAAAVAALAFAALAPADNRPGVLPASVRDCPTTHPIKGNFTTYDRSRCIAHPPGGAYYARTNPERCYSSMEQAINDGCRPSKR